MWPCIWEVVRSREIQPLIQERRLSTLDGKGFLSAVTRTFAMPCVLCQKASEKWYILKNQIGFLIGHEKRGTWNVISFTFWS